MTVLVEATAETAVSTAGTSHQINLPSGTRPDESILILLDKGSTAATMDALAGWTEIVDENLGNGIAAWQRRADGTEGATVTFTSSASTRSASIAYRLSGALGGASGFTIGTVGTGTSTDPDPGNCDPGVSKEYLWIAFFGGAGEEADDDTWANSAPANYTNLLQKACGTAGTNLGGKIAAAQRTLTASSEDAGTFNQDVSTAWRAYTIAVHPAAPVPPIRPQMAPMVAA